MVIYFGIGCLIALAVIICFFSKLGALLCLVAAYILFRMTRNDGMGESIISDIESALGQAKPMEVLEEAEDELVIRGSERLLIINRKNGTISGIDALLTTFSEVQNIKIDKEFYNDSSIVSSYSVNLSLGTFSSICLGFTKNEIDASVMANTISRWIGKKVVA